MLAIIILLGLFDLLLGGFVIKIVFIDGVPFEDEDFKWKWKLEFSWGKGGVYGIRKVYYFMGAK